MANNLLSSSSPSALRPYVFISYARKDSYDRNLSARLGEALRIRKVSFFRDEVTIETGMYWREEIEKGLAQATHFVVILSSESEKSEWVGREIDRILQRGQEVTIIGLQRSQSARFPRLTDNIQLVECDEIGTEINAVFAALRLPVVEELRFPTSSQLRQSTPTSLLHAELCDRQDAEDTFRESFEEFLRQYRGIPQAHFLIGDEDEQHDSFVRRLTWTYLEPYALARGGELGEVVVPRIARIDWPQRWTPVRNQAALLANVFDAFFPRYSAQPEAEMTPEAFVRGIAGSPAGLVALVHTISSKRWDAGTPKLIEEYLSFWRQIGLADGRRNFFIFFNICHQRETKSALRRAIRKAVEKLSSSATLAAESRIAPASLLDLECVRREHVRKWFNQQNDAIFVRCDRACEELFSLGNGCQPMARVEEVLRSAQTASLREAS